MTSQVDNIRRLSHRRMSSTGGSGGPDFPGAGRKPEDPAAMLTFLKEDELHPDILPDTSGGLRSNGGGGGLGTSIGGSSSCSSSTTTAALSSNNGGSWSSKGLNRSNNSFLGSTSLGNSILEETVGEEDSVVLEEGDPDSVSPNERLLVTKAFHAAHKGRMTKLKEHLDALLLFPGTSETVISPATLPSSHTTDTTTPTTMIESSSSNNTTTIISGSPEDLFSDLSNVKHPHPHPPAASSSSPHPPPVSHHSITGDKYAINAVRAKTTAGSGEPHHHRKTTAKEIYTAFKKQHDSLMLVREAYREERAKVEVLQLKLQEAQQDHDEAIMRCAHTVSRMEHYQNLVYQERFKNKNDQDPRSSSSGGSPMLRRKGGHTKTEELQPVVGVEDLVVCATHTAGPDDEEGRQDMPNTVYQLQNEVLKLQKTLRQRERISGGIGGVESAQMTNSLIPTSSGVSSGGGGSTTINGEHSTGTYNGGGSKAKEKSRRGGSEGSRACRGCEGAMRFPCGAGGDGGEDATGSPLISPKSARIRQLENMLLLSHQKEEGQNNHISRLLEQLEKIQEASRGATPSGSVGTSFGFVEDDDDDEDLELLGGCLLRQASFDAESMTPTQEPTEEPPIGAREDTFPPGGTVLGVQ